jgi:hypothetical protein
VKIIAKPQVATKDEDPTAWASHQLELADQCLKQFDQKQRCEKVEKTIAYCESATEVFTMEKFPDKWTDVQMKLCGAYMQRVEGVRRDNMEKATLNFEACKQVRPDETLPVDFLRQQWARGANARKAVIRSDVLMVGGGVYLFLSFRKMHLLDVCLKQVCSGSMSIEFITGHDAQDLVLLFLYDVFYPPSCRSRLCCSLSSSPSPPHVPTTVLFLGQTVFM